MLVRLLGEEHSFFIVFVFCYFSNTKLEMKAPECWENTKEKLCSLFLGNCPFGHAGEKHQRKTFVYCPILHER